MPERRTVVGCESKIADQERASSADTDVRATASKKLFEPTFARGMGIRFDEMTTSLLSVELAVSPQEYRPGET